MPPSDEVHVILLLDLAIENPISETIVISQMPPRIASSSTIFRLTAYGANKYQTGTPNDWRPTIRAIDRMLVDARSAERGGAIVRYWIAGRAGLPAFFHVGYRLTKNAVVTLVNPRNSSPPDVLWLDRRGSRDAISPYFVCSTLPSRFSLASERVNLLVSVRTPIVAAQIQAQMPERSIVVEAQARDFLDMRTVATAIRELDDTMVGIRSSYPGCAALGVFMSGSAPLAFLVGRTINPHIFGDVQVFQHRDNQYKLAYETQLTGRGSAQHTILLLASNPISTNQLALDEEARSIQHEIDRGEQRDTLSLQTRWAAQPLDVLHELRRLKPTILHFSGHAGEDGLFFRDVDGLPSVVGGDDIARTIEAVEAPVQVVVLNACYSESQADALLTRVPCVIGMSAKIGDKCARRFAIGFYGGLAHGGAIESAYKQGCAAIALEGFTESDLPKLRVQAGMDASTMTLDRLRGHAR